MPRWCSSLQGGAIRRPADPGYGPCTSRVGPNTIVAPLFIGPRPPYPGGHEDPQAARPCRRRNAAARSRAHCRQRHRFSLWSIRRLSGVSACPLPHWVGIFSIRILRRSILGKCTTAVLLVQSRPPLPTNSMSVRDLRRTSSVIDREARPLGTLPWHAPYKTRYFRRPLRASINRRIFSR
jgi:hypothetical protein